MLLGISVGIDFGLWGETTNTVVQRSTLLPRECRVQFRVRAFLGFCLPVSAWFSPASPASHGLGLKCPWV